MTPLYVQFSEDGRGGGAGLNKERALLFAAQAGICAGCGLPMLRPSQIVKGMTYHPLAPTVDHVVPRSAGGRDNPSNKVLMHRGCNAWKAARMPNGCELIWLELVKSKVPQPRRAA